MKFPTPDGSWHHLCVSWTNAGGVASAYMDGTRVSFSTIGDGVTFISGGRVLVGAVQAKNSQQLEGEVTYMNLWDKVLSEASIQSLAHSCQAETGNVLQWSFFAAMVVGAVQNVPFSACTSKGTTINSALRWLSIADSPSLRHPTPPGSISVRLAELSLPVPVYANELRLHFVPHNTTRLMEPPPY